MEPNPQFPADWSHVLKKSLMKTSFFVQCDILIGTKSKFFKVSLEVSQIEDTIKFQSYFNVGQKVTPKLVLATLLFKVGDTTQSRGHHASIFISRGQEQINSYPIDTMHIHIH